MDDKKLLIVGIDPGTTTAYAMLDIEGKLVHLNSSKQLDLNSLISQIIGFGHVILVGTDKVKVPGLIGSFAAKLGARVISPDEDLKVSEKRVMTRNFSFGNEHEGDALASALFAYKTIKALLDKIDSFVEDNKKHSIGNRLKELVIGKRISIKSAASIIEHKDEEDKIMENVIVDKKLSENNFLKLYNKLKKYESEIRLIKAHNNNLKNKIIHFENLKTKSEREDLIKHNKKLIDFRESRIRYLERNVKSRERYIEQLKFLIKKLNSIMSDMNNFYILKKLETLGINEFNFNARNSTDL